MQRVSPRAVRPLLAAAAIACDRVTPPVPVREVDAQVVAQLERIGYHGPAVIASRTVTDERGTREIASGLYLPQTGLTAIRRADTRGPRRPRRS